MLGGHMYMLNDDPTGNVLSYREETKFSTLGGVTLNAIDTVEFSFDHRASWEERIDALSKLFLGKASDGASPTEVIENGPATVTYFSDGRRTVATCKGDDEYSLDMGILICALKRVCEKRDRVDEWEDTLKALDGLGSDEMRTLSKALSVAADIRDVAETQEKWDEVVSDLAYNPKIAKALKGSKVTDDGDMVTVRTRRLIDKPHGRAIARAVQRHFGHRNVTFDCGGC